MYWLVKKGEPLEKFKPAQKHLASVLGTDSTVCDLSRVMRVPGFLYCKNDEPSSIVMENTGSGFIH